MAAEATRLLALRGRLAVRLLDMARWLLEVKSHDGDYDTCNYCGATGCEDGTEEHRSGCPSETGVFPVELSDLWPGGPAVCEGCGSELWPGDSYAHIAYRTEDGDTVEDFGGASVYEIRCVGCQVLDGVRDA